MSERGRGGRASCQCLVIQPTGVHETHSERYLRCSRAGENGARRRLTPQESDESVYVVRLVVSYDKRKHVIRLLSLATAYSTGGQDLATAVNNSIDVEGNKQI